MPTEYQLAKTQSGELTKLDAEPEVLPPSAIELMQRAEIDVQIATAHRFPRSMQKFKTRAIEMATLDEETAASCLYSRPVGGGKFAEGLSVRTAEIVGACYGNLRVAAMIVEQNERFVKCRGMAHDLETNFSSACEVIESTIKRDGSPYDERMRVVIAKACLAKARRDATFQVVPKALCKPIEQAARAVAIGDASTIAKRRDQVLAWIGKLGLDVKRVFAALSIKGEEEIGLEQLATLNGLRTAIKDGDVTVDEAFPPIIAAGKVGDPLTDAVKKLAPEKPKAKAESKQPDKVPEPDHDPEPVKPEATPAPEPEKPEPTSKPAKSAGPSADELRMSILTAAKKANIGKPMVVSYFGGEETWSGLDANTLAGALDAWEETKAAILNQ